MAPVAAAFPQPLCSVDLVIFTVVDERLQVLLMRRPDGPQEPFPGQWALPGGFVRMDQDADLLGCAHRTLGLKTGVTAPYLEQLGCWGDVRRDPRGWSVTHVYFALMPAREVQLLRGANAADVAWFELDQPKTQALRLAFDHRRLLDAAIDRLRGRVEYTSLPAFLLDEPFTLPQLQKTYEAVLGREVDKSAFRTRMMAADFLLETGLVETGVRRPPMGYRLKDRREPVVFPRTFSPRNP